MNFTISIEHTSGRIITIKSIASILRPVDNAVMFIGPKFVDLVNKLFEVSDCLVFIVPTIELSDEMKMRHQFIQTENPRKDFAKFLEINEVGKLPSTSYINLDGAMVSNDAVIGEGVSISPFVFIDQDVIIGDNCKIHSGVKLLSGVTIGVGCEIQENTVIGSIAMAYEQDQKIPQLGGVCIGDNVSIGANCIIDRGAIEDTSIDDNVKIGSLCAIGHNVKIGNDSMIIAGTILLGSVQIGRNNFVSGNVIVKNGITIGDNVFIGLGSVVIQNILFGARVFGNPARAIMASK